MKRRERYSKWKQYTKRFIAAGMVLLFAMGLLTVSANERITHRDLIQLYNVGAVTAAKDTAEFYIAFTDEYDRGISCFKYTVSGLQGYAYSDPHPYLNSYENVKPITNANLKIDVQTIYGVHQPPGLVLEKTGLYITSSTAVKTEFHFDNNNASDKDSSINGEFGQGTNAQTNLLLHYGFAFTFDGWSFANAANFKALKPVMDKRVVDEDKIGRSWPIDESKIPNAHNRWFDNTGKYWGSVPENGVYNSYIVDDFNKALAFPIPGETTALRECKYITAYLWPGDAVFNGSNYITRPVTVPPSVRKFYPSTINPNYQLWHDGTPVDITNSLDLFNHGIEGDVTITMPFQDMSGTTWETKDYTASGVNTYTINDNDVAAFVFRQAPLPHQVEWDANGGTLTDYIGNTGSGKTTAHATLEYGKSYYDNVSRLNPTWYGYNFTGWYDKQPWDQGSQVWNKDGSAKNNSVSSENGNTYWRDGNWSYSDRAYNLKFYAHWKPKDISVTFDANGGTISDYINSGGARKTTTTAPLRFGTNLFDNVLGLDPQNGGGQFLGWYDAPEGGNLVWNEVGACVNDRPKGDPHPYWHDGKWSKDHGLTVYAHWKDTGSTVTWDVNADDATLYDYINTKTRRKTASATLKYDSNLYDNVKDLDPQRPGHRFVGWKFETDPDAGDNSKLQWNVNGYRVNDKGFWSNGLWKKTDGNYRMVAVWVQNTTLVTWDANGGELFDYNATNTWKRSVRRKKRDNEENTSFFSFFLYLRNYCIYICMKKLYN